MIVSPDEMDLILTQRRLRRRVMRLPYAEPPPLRYGRAYVLRAKRTKRKVTITIIEQPRRELLEAITLAEARREGFMRVDEAIKHWIARHGEPQPQQQVWVCVFVLGDETAFYEQPVYLGNGERDYTTMAKRAAYEGGTPVEATIVNSTEAERKRVLDLARRQAPERDAVTRMIGEAESLRDSMAGMKFRNRMRLIQHHLGKAMAELPVQEVVGCARPAAEARDRNGAVLTQAHSGNAAKAQRAP